MLTARVLACSHYMDALSDATALPSLADGMRAVCRKPFRRIDRFVQLALLGSARCAKNHELLPDCGMYLSSSHGPLTSNIRVQQQMLREHELPKPFNFVNTLGSIAGFYVADNLQLSGPSLFVSRHARSMEVVLETALIDLAAGAVEQALVGVVEEAPLPLADQRQRLRYTGNPVLAEGSHWMLLAASTPEQRQCGFSLHRFADGDALGLYLAAHMTPSTVVGLGRALGLGTVQQVRRHGSRAVDLADPSMLFHGSVEAAWFVEQIESTTDADVMLVNGGEGDVCLLHFSAQAPID